MSSFRIISFGTRSAFVPGTIDSARKGGSAGPQGMTGATGPSGPIGATGPSSFSQVININNLQCLSTIYSNIAYILNDGKSKIQSPTRITIGAQRTSFIPSPEITYRLQDVTNVTTIATSTPSTVPSTYPPTLIDIGAISNVSGGPSIWELQAKKNSDDELTIKTFTLSLLFEN